MTAAALGGWLAVGTLLSVMIAAAAALAQQLAGRGVPARLIWAVALIAAGGISLSLPIRREAPSQPIVVAGRPLPAATIAVTPPSLVERLVTAGPALATQSVRQVSAAGARALGALPPAAQPVVVWAWPVASAGLLLLLVVSYRMHRARLRGLPEVRLERTAVRVSPNTGPAVIGAIAPTIVVPAWLLSRTEAEQQLVLAHERAHIEARDPLLLLAATALVALMPWNAAAWYLLARLRLAIEVDCDARLVAAGTDRRAYGQLLIALSATVPPMEVPLGAPAFSFRTTHLERRLRTMTARPTRFAAARRLAAVAVGAAALLAACGAELPTAADLQGMDVAKAEARIGKVITLDSGTTRYLVDGQLVEAGTARSIDAERINTIEVRKAGDGIRELRLATKSGEVKVVKGELLVGEGKDAVVIRIDSSSAPKGVVGFRAPGAAGDPLFLIDGKKSTKADLDKLNPSQIQTIEVIKGPAAAAKFGADGQFGVVVVMTKGKL